MQYAEILSQFSAAIRQQKALEDTPLSDLVSATTRKHFFVYHRNALAHTYHLLADGLSTVLSRVGEDNFAYLARAFLMEETHSAVNVNRLSEQFVTFLESKLPVHGDAYLASLAMMDCLSVRGTYGGLDTISVLVEAVRCWMHEQQMQAEIARIEGWAGRVQVRSSLDDGEYFLHFSQAN